MWRGHPNEERHAKAFRKERQELQLRNHNELGLKTNAEEWEGWEKKKTGTVFFYKNGKSNYGYQTSITQQPIHHLRRHQRRRHLAQNAVFLFLPVYFESLFVSFPCFSLLSFFSMTQDL